MVNLARRNRKKDIPFALKIDNRIIIMPKSLFDLNFDIINIKHVNEHLKWQKFYYFLYISEAPISMYELNMMFCNTNRDTKLLPTYN